MFEKNPNPLKKRKSISRRRRGRRKKRPSERCYNLNELWGCLKAIRRTWALFKKFSSSTSMHGIKYMTEPGRPWPERLVWLISIALCIYFASSQCLNLFYRWNMNADEFKFTENSMKVWQIPFVAFTLCPVGELSPLNEKYKIDDALSGKPLRNVSYNVGETIQNVVWRGKKVNANQYFTKVATEEGFCFTFNMMRFDDIFKENT